MRITNPPPGHDSLDGVSTSDHHTIYSDANARSAVVEDTAYEAGWNGDTTHAPSQNAVFDKFEAIVPSDTTYAGSWNGVTTIAPSKNAVYDKIELMVPSDTTYAASWDAVTDVAPSKNAVYDKIQTLAMFATGSYTGDGTGHAVDTTVGLAISGLGFQPKYVHIARRYTTNDENFGSFDLVWTIPEILDDNASKMSVSLQGTGGGWEIRTLKIVSFEADGFTVSAEDAGRDPNTSGVIYNFHAIG